MFETDDEKTAPPHPPLSKNILQRRQYLAVLCVSFTEWPHMECMRANRGKEIDDWHFDGRMEKLNTPMISHLIYQNANAWQINTTVYLLHRLFCWYRNCSKHRTGGVGGGGSPNSIYFSLKLAREETEAAAGR